MFGHLSVLSILKVDHFNYWYPKIGQVVLRRRVCRVCSCIFVVSTSKGDTYLKVDNIILVDNRFLVLKFEYLKTSFRIDKRKLTLWIISFIYGWLSKLFEKIYPSTLIFVHCLTIFLFVTSIMLSDLFR